MRRYGLLFAFAVLVALNGCGGGDGERLSAPAIDLTGHWATTAMDCDTFGDQIPESELTIFEEEFEFRTELPDEGLEDPGTRVVQTGNELVITDVASGLQIDGTLSGDQVRWTYSDQQSVDGLDVSIHVESEGTALDADTIAITQELNWTVTIERETLTGGELCTGTTTRVPSPPQS